MCGVGCSAVLLAFMYIYVCFVFCFAVIRAMRACIITISSHNQKVRRAAHRGPLRRTRQNKMPFVQREQGAALVFTPRGPPSRQLPKNKGRGSVCAALLLAPLLAPPLLVRFGRLFVVHRVLFVASKDGAWRFESHAKLAHHLHRHLRRRGYRRE